MFPLLFAALLSGYSGSITDSPLTTRATDRAYTSTAFRLSNEAVIRIDGVLDESVWKNHPDVVRQRFRQIKPDYGLPSRNDTEYAIYYDDSAVYLAIRMYDDEPHLIPRELTPRDGFNAMADVLGIAFDPYQKAQTGYGFFVSSAGVQSDQLFLGGGGEDPGWNAVWESAVSIDEFGWIVELRIPFAAIRFPAVPIQEWGFLIYRVNKRHNEESFSVPLDLKVSGLMNQFGTLTGIRDVKPPLRLELYPYASTVRSSYGSSSSSLGYNFGTDLRYGINEAFTLDLTLVPDFSQVQTDNVILNLSPFDVRYQENRPFFSEGTELFDHGNLFYSRRIGESVRSAEDVAKPGETVSRSAENPALLNAFKITGRASNGVGVGFLNAVTRPTHAKFTDDTGNSNERRVDPWMNFNILSIDRTFAGRNRIGMLNTNVWRGDGLRKANVTNVAAELFDKTNTYALQLNGFMSNVTDNGPRSGNGFRGELEFGKISGTFTSEYQLDVATEDYDINDFGFQNSPNYVEQKVDFRYNRPEGFGAFQSTSAWVEMELEQRLNPFTYEELSLEFGGSAQTKNNHNMFGWVWGRPSGQNDFFEARRADYILFRPTMWMTGMGYNTDNRKAIRFNVNHRYGRVSEWNQDILETSLTTRVRLSDQVNISHQIERSLTLNARGGFSGNVVGSEVLIGSRDVRRLINSVTMNYTISVKQSANLRMYHNWSRVSYNGFYALGTNRLLTPTATVPLNSPQTNFNFLSVDFNYQFQFAPGSYLNLNAKTNLNARSQDVSLAFAENFQEVLDQPRFTSLSAKVIWFFNRW
jgi:hypothetical protein